VRRVVFVSSAWVGLRWVQASCLPHCPQPGGSPGPGRRPLRLRLTQRLTLCSQRQSSRSRALATNFPLLPTKVLPTKRIALFREGSGASKPQRSQPVEAFAEAGWHARILSLRWSRGRRDYFCIDHLPLSGRLRSLPGFRILFEVSPALVVCPLLEERAGCRQSRVLPRVVPSYVNSVMVIRWMVLTMRVHQGHLPAVPAGNAQVGSDRPPRFRWYEAISWSPR
jgi:hypothetical protein